MSMLAHSLLTLFIIHNNSVQVIKYFVEFILKQAGYSCACNLHEAESVRKISSLKAINNKINVDGAGHHLTTQLKKCF